MDIAAAEKPDDLITDMVPVEQDEHHQYDDDADRQERMQERQHERGNRGETRVAALNAHDRPGGYSVMRGKIIGKRGHHRHEAGQGAAAFREIADVLDLVLEV